MTMIANRGLKYKWKLLFRKHFSLEDFKYNDLVIPMGTTYNYGKWNGLECRVRNHITGFEYEIADDSLRLISPEHVWGTSYDNKYFELLESTSCICQVGFIHVMV